MPNNITDVSTFTTPVVVPADGDIRNASSVAAGFQGLANRTAYLNSLVNTSGVPNIRFGTAATMQAISGMADGAVFLVTSPTHQGLFVYAASNTTTADSVMVYPSTGTGRWIHASYEALGVASGFASVGSNGKLAQRVPNQLMAVGVYAGGPAPSTILSSTASASYVDTVATFTITGTVTGDQILVTGHASIQVDGNSSVGVKAVLVDGGSSIPIAETEAFAAASTQVGTIIPIQFVRTIITGGNAQVKLQMLFSFGTTGTVSNLRGTTQLTGQLIRP